MPGEDMWWNGLSLADYNTRVVLAGNALLGMAAGMAGTFALLRRRALVGDALCHAALPGIAAAFLIAQWLSWDSKSTLVLMTGGAISGCLGIVGILMLKRWTFLPDDAVLGIVLSSFFGGGIALLTCVQQMEEGHAAGLETFLYGRAATLLAQDAWLIAAVGLGVVTTIVVLFKELKLYCFDSRFAAATGLGLLPLDGAIMVLVAIVLLVGLQAVGLILMVALLVMPAAAARFWTDDLWRAVWLAGVSGGLCGGVGAAVSGMVTSVPTGAAIVLVGSLWFAVSMGLGASRGIILKIIRYRFERRRTEKQHALRACFELAEAQRASGASASEVVSFEALLGKREWTPRHLAKILRTLELEGLVVHWGGRDVRLTAAGARAGAMLTHHHRLWELYLLRHGELALHRVDESADEIEHVMDAHLTSRLESIVLGESKAIDVASPHPLNGSEGGIVEGDQDSPR